MDVDDSTFEEIVSAYYAPLYRFAFSLSHEEEEACDLTQETFRRLASKGHQLRDESKIKTWLFTTLYREFLRHSRSAARFQPIELAESRPDSQTDGAVIGDRIDAAAAREVLMQIDELHRAPLILFYLEEHSYSEIAEILSIPIGTVMSRIARGRDILRKALEDKPAALHGTIVPLKTLKTGVVP